MINLKNGMFYGPGNHGEQDIQNGFLSNFIITAPMTGHIPFLNNGANKPNVLAEYSHTGLVDGMLSDGTKINENVNAAFVLDVKEPETQETIKLFVSSVSRETVSLDDNDNLSFNLTAGFDSGFAQDVIQLPIQFTTGLVEVPISEKKKLNLPGGHDFAGPFPAGTLMAGRFGDMDQDGFLDGTFVLADNTPFELLIAEGDPVLLVRPFTSDIPINAIEAAYYELNGLTKNLFNPLLSAIQDEKHVSSKNHTDEILSRIDAVLANFSQIDKKKKNSSKKQLLLSLRSQLEQSRVIVSKIKKTIYREQKPASDDIKLAFTLMIKTQVKLAKVLGKSKK